MRVSEGPDTFEFRSAHGMKAAHSRLRTFADIAVRHLQHFNHPGRAWHDLSGPQDTSLWCYRRSVADVKPVRICAAPRRRTVSGPITLVLCRPTCGFGATPTT